MSTESWKNCVNTGRSIIASSLVINPHQSIPYLDLLPDLRRHLGSVLATEVAPEGHYKGVSLGKSARYRLYFFLKIMLTCDGTNGKIDSRQIFQHGDSAVDAEINVSVGRLIIVV